MKIKKWMAMGIISTLIAGALTGCSSSSKPAAKEQAAAGKKVDFPKKQIEMIVPFAAGGGTDAVARALADSAKNHLSQPIGVVNKTGGGGAVGFNEGAKAKPDGYTLTMVTVELSTLPNLGLATFTSDDFKPVARINADPAAVTVSADAPWNTLDEFLKYAKENPGKVRIGNAGNGSIWHLAAASLEEKTGAKFNHVPFDGAAPAVTALLGKHIEAVTVSPAEVGSQVQAGKLKMLGIMADQRVDKFKDVPTLKEKGIDLSIGTWRGIAVPKNTPQEVVDVLKGAFEKASKEQTFVDVLNKMGLGQSYADDAAFGDAIKKDNANFKALIDKLGLKK